VASLVPQPNRANRLIAKIGTLATRESRHPAHSGGKPQRAANLQRTLGAVYQARASRANSSVSFRVSFVAASLLLLAIGAGSGEEGQLAAHLLADARCGRLANHDLISACLIAGGLSASELAARQEPIDAALDQAIAALDEPSGLQHRAQQLHSALHQHLLTGSYDRQASDLSRTFATGDYNCLTATALYVELCNRAGVSCHVFAQPGHVFCVVGTPAIRVEPASRQSPSASIVASAPQSRQITPIQLAARFAYNRGVQSLERRQFEIGINSLRLACQLDPDDSDARANLLAGLNNWAVSLAEEQPAAAAALIARGLAIDPHYTPLVANERYVAERLGAARQ